MSTSDGYLLQSAEETARLSQQHLVLKQAMGSLIAPPLNFADAPLSILDSGTSDGTWLLDVVRSSLNFDHAHTFVGTDIETINFPTNAPPNVFFSRQDINSEWPTPWQDAFDLVHQRLGLVGAGPYAKLAVTRLAKCVKPGGWIQIVEAENTVVGGKERNPQMFRCAVFLERLFGAMGSSPTLSQDLSGWLREIGFESVEERIVDCQWGASNENAQLATASVSVFPGLVRRMSVMVESLPVKKIGYTTEILLQLAHELTEELGTKGANYAVRVVWGRKSE